MTNLQAIDLLKGLEQSLDDYCELNDEGKTAFRMAITALEVFGLSEQLPSAQPDVPDTNVGDMISRQVAMEMLMVQNVILDGSEYHNGFNVGINRAQEVIRNLPPVQPKRGKWIPEYKNPCYNGYYKIPSYCSCCKDYYTQSPEEMNFCPHCGADMRGGVDG